MDWQTVEEYDHGVEVRVRKDSDPYLVAVFDDGERVTEPVAALQADDVNWEAAGYSNAKARYSDDIEHE